MLFALGPWLRQDPTTGGPFMDLVTSQTAAGDKTLSGVTRFSKTAQAGAAETIAVFEVDDDAAAEFRITNATSGNGLFIPQLSYIGTVGGATSSLVYHYHQLGAGMDTGTMALETRTYRNSAGGQVGSRDLWQVINGATSVLSQNFRGALTLTQLTFAGAQETYLTINQVGLTSYGWRCINSVATDGELAPESLLLATSTQTATHSAQGDTDTGSNPITRYRSRIGASTTATTRPTHAWANNTRDDAMLTASGSFALLTGGQGLRVAEGSNCKQGVATLVAGTVTVPNTSVTANSRIFLTAQDNSTTGALRVSARTAGTSFVITSSNAGDSGVVAYEIFEPS